MCYINTFLTHFEQISFESQHLQACYNAMCDMTSKRINVKKIYQKDIKRVLIWPLLLKWIIQSNILSH